MNSRLSKTQGTHEKHIKTLTLMLTFIAFLRYQSLANSTEGASLLKPKVLWDNCTLTSSEQHHAMDLNFFVFGGRHLAL